MDRRNKVCVFCACHCAPKVLKTTLGTWLEAYDGSYDVDVYVGVHKNYAHYHPGLAEIGEMEPPVKLVFVDEMDWNKPSGSGKMSHVMRYSEMHARSLLAMMKRAKEESGDFTHAAIIDHDLVFKTDFIGWAVKQDADMVGLLYGGREKDMDVKTNLGDVYPFAPKPSAWHLVVSRTMFESMLEWPDMVKPGMHGGRIFDTAAWGYEMAKRWGMRTLMAPEADVKAMVVHSWSMSFNYGALQEGGPAYKAKVKACEDEYDRRFPKGIGELLRKVVRT